MARSGWLVCVLAGALVACDGASPTSDAGGGGSDSGEIDAGASGTPFTYATLVREDPGDGTVGAPIVGARVVVDTSEGRFEGATGADGIARVDATTADGRFDALFLADGRMVLSSVGEAVADLGSEPTPIQLPAFPVVSSTRHVSVSATNVPPGGRWCLSAGSWYNLCSGLNPIEVDLPAAASMDRFVAVALDADGNVTDVVDGPLAGDPATGTASFDDTSDVTITSREITIRLPPDPEGPFADPTTLPEWHGWLVGAEPGSYLLRGMVTNATPVDGMHALRATFWQYPREDETLVHAGGAYPHFRMQGAVRVFRWYVSEPEGDVAFMDVPRPLSEGEPLDASLRWTPVAGADFYAVQVELDDGVALRVVTRSTAGARLPTFPAEFDATAIFPPGEAFAQLRVIAVQGTPPPVTGATGDPYSVDAQLARGPAFSLTR